jgi:nucleotide-binding universal stress UspA family protein
VIGIDLGLAALREAAQRGGATLQAVGAALHCPPVAASRADRVLLADGREHGAAPPAAGEAAARLLAPGGLLFVNTIARTLLSRVLAITLAMRQLTKLEEKLQAELVPYESSHALGSPISLIVDRAEKCGADYIVMGSHGHTALYDLLVGSTTHGVLMRAKCPVVIVPAVKDATSKKARKARPAALD